MSNVKYEISITWDGEAYAETRKVSVCEAKYKRIEAILDDKCNYCDLEDTKK